MDAEKLGNMIQVYPNGSKDKTQIREKTCYWHKNMAF